MTNLIKCKTRVTNPTKKKLRLLTRDETVPPWKTAEHRSSHTVTHQANTGEGCLPSRSGPWSADRACRQQGPMAMTRRTHV